VSFLNKCDETERTIVAEYYQRCLGEDLTGASAALALKAVEK
jgi:cobaltochelatase CobS